jgi:uncharacterized protein (DUF1330 family)
MLVVMPAAYAIAHLHNPTVNDDVVEYLERIQDTMDPFGGRFLVHGPTVEAVEGAWPGTIVILTFPDLDAARAWYRSPAYQEILHLRTDHIDGVAILAEGVPPEYDVRHTAEVLRASMTP